MDGVATTVNTERTLLSDATTRHQVQQHGNRLYIQPELRLLVSSSIEPILWLVVAMKVRRLYINHPELSTFWSFIWGLSIVSADRAGPDREAQTNFQLISWAKMSLDVESSVRQIMMILLDQAVGGNRRCSKSFGLWLSDVFQVW